MRTMENKNVSRQRGFKQTRTLSVLLLAGDIQCKSAFEIAARVCAGAKQQLEALGVAVRGGSVNWRNAVLVALVDVAARQTTFIGQTGCPERHVTLMPCIWFWVLCLLYVVKCKEGGMKVLN